MVNTEAIIRHAIQENVKLTLVVNKIDRLILELRIKPADAFYKIKHTIEEVNTIIRYNWIFLLNLSGSYSSISAPLIRTPSFA